MPESTHLQEWTSAAILKANALYVRLYEPVSDWPADPLYTAAKVAEKWKLSSTIRPRCEPPWRGPGCCQILGIRSSVVIVPFANAPLDHEVDDIDVVLVHALQGAGATGRADRRMKITSGQIPQGPLTFRHRRSVPSTSAVCEG